MAMSKDHDAASVLLFESRQRSLQKTNSGAEVRSRARVWGLGPSL